MERLLLFDGISSWSAARGPDGGGGGSPPVWSERSGFILSSDVAFLFCSSAVRGAVFLRVYCRADGTLEASPKQTQRRRSGDQLAAHLNSSDIGSRLLSRLRALISPVASPQTLRPNQRSHPCGNNSSSSSLSLAVALWRLRVPIIRLSALIPLLCSVMNSNSLVIICSALVSLFFFFSCK